MLGEEWVGRLSLSGSICHVLQYHSVTKTQSPEQSMMGLEEFTPLAGSVTSKKVYLEKLRAERVL